MWSGEVQDIERREAKKKRREEKRQRKRSKMLNLISNISQSSRDLQSTSAINNGHNSSPQSPNLVRTTSRVASAFPSRTSSILRRFPTSRRDEDAASQIELDVLSHPLAPASENSLIPRQVRSPTTETSSSTNDTPSPTGRKIFSFLRKPVFLQQWLGTLSEAHNEAAKQQARTAGPEQVRRFGIRAMTQRVIMERTGMQRGHSHNGRFSPPRTPTAAHSSRARPSAARAAEVDSDNWVSDDEPAQHPPSGPSSYNLRQPSLSGSSMDHHYEPSRASHAYQDRYTRLPKSSPQQPQNLDLGLRLERSPRPPSPTANRVYPSLPSSPRQQPLPASSSHEQRSYRSWRRPLPNPRLRDVTSYD